LLALIEEGDRSDPARFKFSDRMDEFDSWECCELSHPLKSGKMLFSKMEGLPMKTQELMERIQFVVNPQGRQSGVLLNLEDWEQLLILLEDLEDAEDIQQARTVEEEEIPWEQAKVELGI
jgi:hypothetical protein